MLPAEIVDVQIPHKFLHDLNFALSSTWQLKVATSTRCLEHGGINQASVVMAACNQHKEVHFKLLLGIVFVDQGEVTGDISVVVHLNHQVFKHGLGS